MRILLDENIPRGLRRILQGHDVRTASEMGWASIANGQLLDEAEKAGFEALVTSDQNFVFQQNLAGRNIAIVVLSTNRLHKFGSDGASFAPLFLIEQNNNFEVAARGVFQGSGYRLVGERIGLHMNAAGGGADGPHDHGFAVVARGEARLIGSFRCKAHLSLVGGLARSGRDQSRQRQNEQKQAQPGLYHCFPLEQVRARPAAWLQAACLPKARPHP
jgi:predicted nuclease of predicted toxin-antitoxin system